ncbi:MAG: MATE family efflux transporter [Clostridia bacterium]|nr:MATE family efflux transporter [Clostridia bacterium]
MARTKDMTVGNPAKLIITFAIPLIITNLGQHFYMMVDAAIVGRGVGVQALAAVGSADWTYWLILWSVTALAQGFSIFISQSFGEQNYQKMNKTIAMSTLLCAVVGFVLTVVGIFATKPVLELLDTPADIIGDATVYLTTMIAGCLIVTAYNMAASILRALGDGRSPLVGVVIAAVLNIGLDLLFVMAFHWGVFGAAFASVMAQGIAFIYCFLQIKKIACVHIEKSDWKPDFAMIKKMLLFATPLTGQSIFIALSGIILQATINAQGSNFVAGYTALNKMYGLLESSAISLGASFSTFFAQNYGAGEKQRVLQGVRSGIILSAGLSLVVMAAMLLFGKNILTMFLDVSKEGGAEAMAVAWRYLKIMSYWMVILYVIYVYRNVLPAMGISIWSMIGGIAEGLVRVGMGIFLVPLWGQEVFYYIEPFSWLAAFLLVIIPYYCCRKKYLL